MNSRLKSAVLGCVFAAAAVLISAHSAFVKGNSAAIFYAMLAVFCGNLVVVAVVKKRQNKDGDAK